jgi:hypothetical protein
MGERLAAGAAVRVTARDVAVHTRAPRYVRGHVGSVVASHREHPLPDSVVAGDDPPRTGTVYAVRFAAAELFGTGDHTVVVDLWEQYLQPVEEAQRVG